MPVSTRKSLISVRNSTKPQACDYTFTAEAEHALKSLHSTTNVRVVVGVGASPRSGVTRALSEFAVAVASDFGADISDPAPLAGAVSSRRDRRLILKVTLLKAL